LRKEFGEYAPLALALKVLKENCKITPQAETISILEANGRVLADDVIPERDLPQYDSSHMDGFALKADDVTSASSYKPVILRVRKGERLGKRPRFLLRSGEAYEVLTGGYLPRGANAVIPVERVHMEGRNIKIASPVERGSFVYPAGTDVKKNQCILEEGATIRAHEIGLLASLRVSRVRVFRKPRVAIIPTGSELTSKISSSTQGQVVETHSHVFSRLTEAAGGEAVNLGITPDELNTIKRKIALAAGRADIILTIAGSSVGGSDLVEAAINECGKPGVLVHGVAIHRGRVVGFGLINGKPVVIMPGPIQGAMNAFAVFAYPLIRTYLGHPFKEPPGVAAVITSDWQARSFKNFTKVVYTKVTSTEHGLLAEPVIGETEKMTLLTHANSFMLVSESVTSIKRGQKIKTHLLPGFSYEGGRFLD
jgi:molybdenum cofactor synthesis domain-containing protein